MPNRQKQGNFKTNRNNMKSAKAKAEELVNKFRITLMNEDTDCGNEILCTSIAIQQSMIAVDEIIEETDTYYDTLIASERKLFLEQVKNELLKL
jgi:hypothetical protein